MKKYKFTKNTYIIIAIALLVFAGVLILALGGLRGAGIFGGEDDFISSADGTSGEGLSSDVALDGNELDVNKNTDGSSDNLGDDVNGGDTSQNGNSQNNASGVVDGTVPASPLTASGETNILVLLNKQHTVDSDYVPKDLVLVKYRAKDRAESNQYMVKVAAEAFDALCEGAKEEGHEIVVTTAYRSYNFQKTLYNNYVAKDGQEAADKYSARPGTSEHQSGLAADVSSPSVNYTLTSDYASTDEGAWLSENCHKYGFIIRYPKDKTDITGYIYEPWHIRYVGEDIAKYIYENELTLEEYLEGL